MLVKNLEELEVECLPTDLPESIEVDISTMTKPGEGIHVRDVQDLGQNPHSRYASDTMVAVATSPRSKRKPQPSPVPKLLHRLAPSPNSPWTAARRKTKAKSKSLVNTKLPDQKSGSF